MVNIADIRERITNNVKLNAFNEGLYNFTVFLEDWEE